MPKMKRFPRLSQLLFKSKKEKSQSIKSQIAAARMWTVAMGGSLMKRKN